MFCSFILLVAVLQRTRCGMLMSLLYLRALFYPIGLPPLIITSSSSSMQCSTAGNCLQTYLQLLEPQQGRNRDLRQPLPKQLGLQLVLQLSQALTYLKNMLIITLESVILGKRLLFRLIALMLLQSQIMQRLQRAQPINLRLIFCLSLLQHLQVLIAAYK